MSCPRKRASSLFGALDSRFRGNDVAALCLAALLPAPALAQGGTLSGPTGLLTVPVAEVLDEGSVRLGASRHDSGAARDPAYRDGVQNYLFTIGFLPGLELGGRLAQAGDFGGASNDLSFNAQYAYRFDSGFALAAGGQDIGGEARNFRSRYVVASLPWRALRVTAGYGWGPDLLDGALGGVEWRPWPFAGAYAEYDGDEVNPGVRLQSGTLWAGLRLGANVGYRGARDDVEAGVQISIPLGRGPGPSPARSASDLSPLAPGAAGEDGAPLIQTQGLEAIEAAPPEVPADTGRWLRAALEELGFEAVRTGTRGDGTLVVALENRRYNHAAADGIGLALGTIAMRAPPSTERIELALSSYGVPQVVVAASAREYRDFLRDGAPAPALEVRYAGAAGDDVGWHNRARLLDAAELVVEPVLRTFVATEYGMLDAAVGARGRLTAPLGRGVLAHVGLQVPALMTDDFRDGRNFDGFGPEAGIDLLMAQYAHALGPGWTALWSAGLMQVYQVDLRTLGVEQVWTSPRGRHRLNAKLMALSTSEVDHRVALGGYTWFDAARRYSVGVTGGRFYLDDKGARLDVNRHFGDTIAGLFLKVEAEDNMAGGFQLSIPLTPRRDAMPRGVQVKGARRWGHSLQSTLNQPDGRNPLRPLLLFEPVTDLDLRRDFLDSNRLSPDWLQAELPRLREAYLLWGN